ncbi:calmodulin-binding transcription activator 6-like isoform X2 [Diospyros lotus]|uniref:calmodulin-binding transcription activator 6-like isoform X2 n=1 Tax=Diospyros lotus TaxID=55363 RepID=UPI00225C1BEC|nr:calmodulin-binding transcription activator 6-like isoform X2 [Diospyros lotus]
MIGQASLISAQMDAPGQRLLAGSEIHGFFTMEDLDFVNILEEAKSRWLRPNEIYAILCNYHHFSIKAKPVNLPQSGAITLFDRKMLRNFRKDGHNWKKKKDGKTVKEAHEHLKVGNEERIHVYYAHGADNPAFVRRCYWLLDKSLENIVLVHYRDTQEGSPITPVDSSSASALSDPSPPWILFEETDSGADPAYHTAEKAELDLGDPMTFKSYEMRLHEINTLEWEELLVPDDPNKLAAPGGQNSERQNRFGMDGFLTNGTVLSANEVAAENSFGSLSKPGAQSNIHLNVLGPDSQMSEGQMNSKIQRKDSQLVTEGVAASDTLVKDSFQSQDSFGRLMNYILTDSPGSVDDPVLGSSIPTGHESSVSPMLDHLQPSALGETFSITDISPAWAFSTEETKILITGLFNEGQLHNATSTIYCICGGTCSPVEIVQSGVLRCMVSPHAPGLVDLYLSFDGHSPVSQVVNFEYRTPPMQDWMISADDKSMWEEFRLQMRLAHLLFSTSKSLNILSSKVSPNTLKAAKIFSHKTSHVANGWVCMVESIKNNKVSFLEAKDSLFDLALKNKLCEWLLERIVDGCKTSDHDDQGQGVIHLCAILNYTWAVNLYTLSGLSLDFRDKFGWTALHWAAYYGRENMVAALLSAGAKPYVVTDPSSENPDGCTAADLASSNGHDGLAAFLAEKALVSHFKDMTMAGNVSGSLQSSTPNSVNNWNLNEDELYLKDSLAAYRTAADAAARIQAAFREQSFKLRKKAVQVSTPEDEARSIIAAMKIQHAFRKYEMGKKMAAAGRIQHRFRTWKIRKEFLNMRRQAIKIQAVFRGFQMRKQYRKIVWSVGILEKVILRWRLKKKGFRGLQVSPTEAIKDEQQGSSVEEEFFRASRKQAEERVERSVVRVQAMFRSKVAQQEYQRMKSALNEARLQYEGSFLLVLIWDRRSIRGHRFRALPRNLKS